MRKNGKNRLAKKKQCAPRANTRGKLLKEKHLHIYTGILYFYTERRGFGPRFFAS
jgi:hypothetical protein